jgi:hypothetical protein
MDAAMARSNTIQEKLWQKLNDVAKESNAMVPTRLCINIISEMIDDQEGRLTTIRNDVPVIVIFGVYGISLIAITVIGYTVRLEEDTIR